MACGMQLSGEGYLLGYQEKSCYLDRGDDDCGPEGARRWAARRRYLVCFYWSVTTISSVGYGDILPRSDNERIFSIFMMLIGGAFYGYVIGETAAIVTSFDANHAECFKKIDTVRSWMDHHGLPNKLRRKVRKSYKVFYQNHMAIDEGSIIQELEPVLQEEIVDFLLPEPVRGVPLFRGMPTGTRSKLVSIMRTIEVEPAACVIRAGEPSNAMFVVVRGKCRVENAKTRSVVEAETGDSFGEQGMLGLRKFSHVTVTTTEPTDLIVFPEDKFMHEFSEMPEVLEELRDTARHLQTLSTGRGSRRSSEKVEAKLISSPSVASSISDAA